MIPEPIPEGQAPGACPRCGVIDRPTLTQGTGPHAIRASCGHCGRFLRWISVLPPAERLARRLHARLQAMQQYPASEAQLDFLKALGDTLSPPATMAEASERIDALKRQADTP